MANCTHCKRIMLGGVRVGRRRFCSERCRDAYLELMAEARFTDDAIMSHVASMHSGRCPKCGGAGPVDVVQTYSLWSAIYLTRFSKHRDVCCRRCGRRAVAGAVARCFFLGWWGILGVFATPIQIVRNVGSAFYLPSDDAVSPRFLRLVKHQLGRQLIKLAEEEDQTAQEDGLVGFRD